MVFVGARRSSPGMREVRYDSLRGWESRAMFPVRGAREDWDWRGWRGSSRSSRFAGKELAFNSNDPGYVFQERSLGNTHHHRDLSNRRPRHVVDCNVRRDWMTRPSCSKAWFLATA